MTDSPSPLSRQAAILCSIAAVASAMGAWMAKTAGIISGAYDPTIPQNSNFYHYTFVRFEPLSLLADAAFFLALAVIFVRCGAATPTRASWLAAMRVPLLVALGVFALTGLGRFVVQQNFDLCIDEYLNQFEAHIFARQHLVATMPPEWRDYEPALRLPYVNYNQVSGYWASGFLPGFAWLDFLADRIHLGWALDPALAALSILLLADLTRRAFPGSEANLAAGLAVLLLAFSPQFLAMATTKFAWTAHLCGSLFWVWLFTHPRRALFLLTPVVGALLIGLHQPHVHLLVALPFLWRLLRSGQWRDLAWFAVWYLAGAFVWYKMMVLLRPVSVGTPGLGELDKFHFSLLLTVVIALFHAITVLAWSMPALPPLVALMLIHWNRQPVLVRDSFLAAAVTFLFYLSFPHEQGHGWGFRYLHSAYGLLTLAATGGAVTLIRAGAQSAVTRAIVAGAAFALLVQIPYRVHEITTLVRPLAQASRFISGQQCDFVIVNTDDFWYSWDLIRNDPWLEARPLIFNGAKLTPEQVAALKAKGSVIVIGADQVRPFGVILSDPAKLHALDPQGPASAP